MTFFKKIIFSVLLFVFSFLKTNTEELGDVSSVQTLITFVSFEHECYEGKQQFGFAETQVFQFDVIARNYRRYQEKMTGFVSQTINEFAPNVLNFTCVGNLFSNYQINHSCLSSCHDLLFLFCLF